MKTATITWSTYLNIGTYLQAFALQYFLKSKGIDNVVIDDYEHTSIAYNNRKSRVLTFLRLIKRRLLFLLEPGRKQEYDMFKHFKEKYIEIDSRSTDYDYLNNTYDLFICGSDQIWNPLTEYPDKDFYFARFSKKTKIAYAPSIGVSQMQSDSEQLFRRRISDFQSLSGREQEGCDIMSRLTGKYVPKVLDPTLLLDSMDYQKLLTGKNKYQESKYIVLYLLTWNESYYNVVQEYSKKYNLELKYINVLNSDAKIIKGGLYVGPEEFLHVIRDAEYVFTDSFHGSIFSMLFEVQFITFLRFANSETSMNSRVVNFHQMIGTEDHIVEETCLQKVFTAKKLNYQSIKNKLRDAQNTSCNYLLNAIEKSKLQ